MVDDNETIAQLSERELQVLEMVATGASNQQIARQLIISANTVKVHLRNIFEKLGVQSRTEAALRAIQEGWIVVADDNAITIENESLPVKTYLYPTQEQTALPRWQQIYLIIAIFLALTVMIAPLASKSSPRIRPNLPVIYVKPPTPVSTNNGSAQWTVQAPMPTQRAGLSLTAFEGRIVAIGGVRTNYNATRLVEIYDPDTNSWVEGAAKPTAAANITGVILDDKIYVPGGCTYEGQAIDSLEIYDPQEDKWTQGQSLPEARCGYGLVLFQDKLYLFGGWNGQSFKNSIFVFLPEENSWSVMESSMPQAKGYMGAAVLNNSIYVVGGYDGQNEFDQTYIFKPDTGEWIEKSPLQEKRGGLGLISAANQLYAIGGGWNQSLTTSEKYDPEVDAWTTFEAPFTHQWRNMGLAVIDTQIYAAGGWNGTEEKFMESVVSYQFLHQIFLPISSFSK